MDDFLDSKIKLCVACVAGGILAGATLMLSVKDGFGGSRAKDAERHIGDHESGIDSGIQTNDLTSFSDITALVGSPFTSAGSSTRCQDMREYRLYTASENYPNLEKNRTIMAKHLTPSLYEILWDKRTPLGFTLDEAIQVGLDNPSKRIPGIIAGDEDCYDVFAPLFDKILAEKYQGFDKHKHFNKIDLDASKLSSPALREGYVDYISFTVGRSIAGHRFLPSLNRAERKEIEHRMRSVCDKFKGKYRGRFFSLLDVDRKVAKILPTSFPIHWLDKPASQIYSNGGVSRDWPEGRAIFLNNDNTLFISINRDDHLRIHYREDTTAVSSAFENFLKAYQAFETELEKDGLNFAYHQNYGFILWSPSVIGTSFKVLIRLKLPRLSKDSRLSKILQALRLSFDTQTKADEFDEGKLEITNVDRIGLTEVQLVERVVNGASLLIAMERRLERALPIDDLLPESIPGPFETEN